ncbi:MAG: DUF2914 domain-containing protein [Nitrospirota bacterium]
MGHLVRGTKDFFSRHRKYMPVVFFLAGFLWDSLTLTRIDNLVDNLVLLAYLLLLGGLIVITNLTARGRPNRPLLERHRRWYPLGIQFFLGGLLSSYVVFYFQSASMGRTSLFLIILVLLLVANEFLENRLENLPLQMSLYFLATSSFLVFFIPVVFKAMNHGTFVLSTLFGLLVTGALMRSFVRRGVFKGRGEFAFTGALVGGLFVMLNVFYVMNWIPPVPLSLKDMGVYHSVERMDGRYRLTYQKPPWYRFWARDDEPFVYAPGDRVYCFTAVFAPVGLTKDIYHLWQTYSPRKKQWVTTDRLPFEISGGRGKGYRGYTFKQYAAPGRWRVEVRTGGGLLVGYVVFDVIAAGDAKRSWTTAVK